MALTFYYLSGSPFSWKVMLALEHLEFPYELKLLSIDRGDLKAPEFLAINPRSKAPAIVDGAFVLRESAAIIEYLADRYGQGARVLWPAELESRAIARRLACDADLYVYPHVRRLVTEILIRGDGQPDAAAVADAKSVLAAEFGRIEGELKSVYLAGDQPSAADFALYPLTAILMRVAAKAPGYGLGEVIGSRLAIWRHNVEALPFFKKTMPPHWRST